MTSSRSIWAQSSLRTRLVAGGAGIVGFALLLFGEYIYGKGNNFVLLLSALWAFTPSTMFALSILSLSVGFMEVRQEHIAWYKQQNFLLGIGIVFLTFSSLTTLGSINRILPPLLALFPGILCVILAFLCIIRSIRMNRVIHRSEERNTKEG